MVRRRRGVRRWATWLALAILTPAALASPASGRAGGIALADVRAAVLAGALETGQVGGDDRGAWTAEIVRPVSARTAPDGRSAKRTTLAPYGVGAHPTTLLAHEAFRDPSRRDWVRVQLDVRPNETTGWVPADAVVLRRTDTRIVIRTSQRRLEVWRGGRRVLDVAAGIGRSGTPTPIGRFAIADAWETDARIRPTYGRYVLALTAHSNVVQRLNGGDGRIAVHAGGSSRRVGARSSFGCVIVSEPVLARLWTLARPGTPVTITAD